MKTRILTVMGAAAVLALAGCATTDNDDAVADDGTEAPQSTSPGQDSAPEDEPMAAAASTVGVSATEYSFDVPAEVDAGLVTFAFANQGGEVHHAQVVRVNDGGSLEAAMGAMAEGDLGTAFQNVSLTGGVGIVPPGGNASSTANLPSGEYAFLCLIENAEGVPHAALGMVSPFTVTGDAPDDPQVEAVGDVILRDFSFEVSEDLDGTVAVTNAGEQPHEMLVFQLGDGVTLEDALPTLLGPPPSDGPPSAIPVGGVQAMMPGDTGYVDLSTLQAGSYGLVCVVPDPATGKHHFELGMATQIQIE